MFADARVVVIMPAFNAARTLLQTWREVVEQRVVDRVVVVDDASSDDTARVARDLPDAVLIEHPRNRGYGASQKSGYRAALDDGADVVVMVHGDYQYPPALIPQLTRAIVEGGCDCALGSRVGRGRGDMPLWRYLGNRALTAAQNRLLATRLGEFHTGYRAWSRPALEAIPFERDSDDFVFDAEMLTQLVFADGRIAEIDCPARYQAEASSIGFARSVVYGLGCLRTAWRARRARAGRPQPLFPASLHGALAR